MSLSDRETAIKNLRTPFESNTEWNLRRKFLLAHYGKFDMNRLICLSNCYVNVHSMGCMYPAEVMNQLNHLGKGLGEDDISDITNLPNKIKGVETVKFVRESSNSGSTADSSGPTPPKMPAYEPPKTVQKPIIKKVVPVFGMNFVKASSEFKSTDVAIHEPASALSDKSLPPTRAKGSGLGYTKPQYNTAGMGNLDSRFKTLASAIREVQNKFGNAKNSIEIFQMAVDKTKMSMVSKFRDVVGGSQHGHSFICAITIDEVGVAEAKANNKKSAKHSAFDDAVKKILCSHVYVDQSDPNNLTLIGSSSEQGTSIPSMSKVQPQSAKPVKSPTFVQSQANYSTMADPQEARNAYTAPCRIKYNSHSFAYNDMGGNYGDLSDYDPNFYESNRNAISVKGRLARSMLNGDISRYLIFEHVQIENNNAVSVLGMSSVTNKALLEYKYQPEHHSATVHCRVYIDGELIAEASGVGKVNAKQLAAARALEELKKICWTVKIKQAVDCPADSNVSKDELMGNIQNQMNMIANDNVGHKLLSKMGWSGGGVGAEGNKGREEPVAVSLQQIVNREGLGLNSAGGMKDFRQNVKTMVENYAKSDSGQDMTFTSDFTKEERAYIHTISQRLGLKSVSRGKDENRYLTISRKRNTDQLFDHLMREGGSTHKYDLIPPENDEY